MDLMVNRKNQVRAFWFDKTRYIGVPSKYYNKLREEYDSVLTAAILLNWEYRVMGLSDGYRVVFWKDKENGLDQLAIEFHKEDKKLVYISATIGDPYSVRDSLSKSRNWSELLRRFREYL
ncbi:hypothetical protein D3C72_1715110 [compost metagenome]